MSKHLFGIILTSCGIAANNRGDTEGNITTLQKILWNGEQHTTVSAEAIRWAVRWYWQCSGKNLNRCWSEEGEKPGNTWKDHEFAEWQKYLDDDVLGFMSAEAAKEEGQDGTGTGARSKGKGKSVIRRARLEITRAISLTPFEGDITFNAASVGATPSASRTGKDPVPYSTEMHATHYQYGFALTPEELEKKESAKDVVDAIVNLGSVGGNHARFLFDFSPESIVFRCTDDFAPRMLYGFSLNENREPNINLVLEKIKANDIGAKELIIGGEVSKVEAVKALANAGATVCDGIKEAAEEVKKRL